MVPESGSACVYPTLGDALDAFEVATQQRVETAIIAERTLPYLEGALARPRYYAIYYGSDLAMQAAVLAHGIAETQPFLNGNKRTALALLGVFLRANGHVVEAPEDALFEWMLDLGTGSLSPSGLAERLRPYIRDLTAA